MLKPSKLTKLKEIKPSIHFNSEDIFSLEFTGKGLNKQVSLLSLSQHAHMCVFACVYVSIHTWYLPLLVVLETYILTIGNTTVEWWGAIQSCKEGLSRSFIILKMFSCSMGFVNSFFGKYLMSFCMGHAC